MGKISPVKKTVIRENALESEGAFYKYALIKKESRKITRYIVPLYSIEIKMTDEDGKSTSAYVNDIFADVGKAIVFYEKLVRNLATPIDLSYVLEDELV